MPGVLGPFLNGKALLLAVAAPAEIRAVLTALTAGATDPLELQGRKIGIVLTKLGRVSRAQVHDALLRKDSRPGNIGELLMSRGSCTESDIDAALNAQVASIDPIAPGTYPYPIPAPWNPVFIPRFNVEVVLTGVGKANAAGAVARLADSQRHGLILNCGVAGALPASSLELGEAIAASASIYADEGLQSPDGFMDCAQMGFPLGAFPGSAVPCDVDVLAVLRPLVRAVGPVATVSTCSGTDALARQVAMRTGAHAEAMEGAAAGQAAHCLSIPFAELRVISNTTGDRPAQRWDLNKALAELSRLIGLLF